MATINWDQTGDKVFETGTKKGVLYTSLGVVAPFSATSAYAKGDIVAKDGKNYKAKAAITAGAWTASDWDEYKSDYATGVAWNGLTAVTESPEGAEETALYADDIKYLSMRSAEEFNFTIEAYTYPDEWMQCDGSAALVTGVPGITVGQQKRRLFGFSFVSTVGNDTEGNDYGEKIHLIYAASASPSEKSYETINDSPEAITMSWECNTTPIDMPNGLKKAAEIVIDTTRLNTEGLTALATLKEAIYGTNSTDAYLPTPEAVFTMFGGTVANG